MRFVELLILISRPIDMTETRQTEEDALGGAGENDAVGFDRKIRVGILVDGEEVPAWIYDMLDRIEASDYASIVQVVRNATPGVPRKSGLSRIKHIWNRAFFTLYSRLDRKLSSIGDDPFSPRMISSMLDSARWIDVTPVRSGFVDRFSKEDLADLRQDDIDVYLRLGFGILKGDVLSAGRLGIWSYHHADNRANRGLPPGFWEIYNREPVIGLTLQMLCEELDGGEVIYRAFSRTNRVYFHQGVSLLFWKSVYVIPQMLERLHRLGTEQFLESVTNAAEREFYYSKPLYSYPTNWQSIRHAVRQICRLIHIKVLNAVYKYQWILLYCRSSNLRSRRSLWRFKKLAPPSDRFWADPFVISVDGRHHIFFEELVYTENKGKISHIAIDEGGNLTDTQVVLEEDYHLSYPFVFDYKGDYYMIPESAENSSVDLYECAEFPHSWRKRRTLIDNIELVDATLLFHNDYWWLFAGQRCDSRLSISEELSIFYCDDLLSGQWIAHPNNPVVSDARYARPAGKIFNRDGVLYRPSQDCTVAYGSAINIRRIDILSIDEYRETQLHEISPDWSPSLCGIHTVNDGDGITVVDALAMRRKFWPEKL